MALKPAVKIDNLFFRYSGSSKTPWLLKNMSLEIKQGAWTTILGPNGSGKSTLAKLISKILKPSDGDIEIMSQNIKNIKGKSFGKKVAYIPQIISTPNDTSVYDFISFGRHPYLTNVMGIMSKKDKDIVKKAMMETGTWEWKNKMMNELSGGQRQKALIAMIVVQDAEIILLDEPTTYLDVRNQYELLEMLHYEHVLGKTIITILHDINQAAQYSDYIFMLKNAEIFNKGKPGSVINKHNLKNVYKIDAELYVDKDRKYLSDIKLKDFKYKNQRLKQSKTDHEHKLKKQVHVNHNK